MDTAGHTEGEESGQMESGKSKGQRVERRDTRGFKQIKERPEKVIEGLGDSPGTQGKIEGEIGAGRKEWRYK